MVRLLLSLPGGCPLVSSLCAPFCGGRAGLTQERLAELAGVGVRTISDLESGVTGNPQRATAQHLAAALPAELQRRLLQVLRATPRRRAGHVPAAGQPLPASAAARSPTT